jgi:hypothetical protein
VIEIGFGATRGTAAFTCATVRSRAAPASSTTAASRSTGTTPYPATATGGSSFASSV